MLDFYELMHQSRPWLIGSRVGVGLAGWGVGYAAPRPGDVAEQPPYRWELQALPLQTETTSMFWAFLFGGPGHVGFP